MSKLGYFGASSRVERGAARGGSAGRPSPGSRLPVLICRQIWTVPSRRAPRPPTLRRGRSRWPMADFGEPTTCRSSRRRPASLSSPSISTPPARIAAWRGGLGRLASRGIKPADYLVDGGFTKNEDIEWSDAGGIKLWCPAIHNKHRTDPYGTRSLFSKLRARKPLRFSVWMHGWWRFLVLGWRAGWGVGASRRALRVGRRMAIPLLAQAAACAAARCKANRRIQGRPGGGGLAP